MTTKRSRSSSPAKSRPRRDGTRGKPRQRAARTNASADAPASSAPTPLALTPSQLRVDRGVGEFPSDTYLMFALADPVDVAAGRAPRAAVPLQPTWLAAAGIEAGQRVLVHVVRGAVVVLAAGRPTLM